MARGETAPISHQELPVPSFFYHSPLLLLAASTCGGLSAHAASNGPSTLFDAPTSTWSLSRGQASGLEAAAPAPGEARFAAEPMSLGSASIAGHSSSTYKSTDNGFFDREARFASGAGNVLFLAGGVLAPLAEDGAEGRQHTLRAADSLLASTLITEGLKSIVRERRPDSSKRNSFPSGHATAAFAVATMQASYHPRQALFWYGGATIIAASRLQLNRHYVQDVVAGAAVGYFTSRLELHLKRGLLLRPFISDREPANTHAPPG